MRLNSATRQDWQNDMDGGTHWRNRPFSFLRPYGQKQQAICWSVLLETLQRLWTTSSADHRSRKTQHPRIANNITGSINNWDYHINKIPSRPKFQTIQPKCTLHRRLETGTRLEAHVSALASVPATRRGGGASHTRQLQNRLYERLTEGRSNCETKTEPDKPMDRQIVQHFHAIW